MAKTTGRLGDRGFWRSGSAFVWLSAGATAFAVILVIGILWIIAAGGLRFFWPIPIERFVLADDTVVLGQVWGSDPIASSVAAYPGERRIRVRAGNRRLVGEREFVAIDESKIRERTRPAHAAIIDPEEYGAYIGFVERSRRGEEETGSGESARLRLESRLPAMTALRSRAEKLENREIGRVNTALEKIRTRERHLARTGQPPDARLEGERARWHARYDSVLVVVNALRDSLRTESIELVTAQDQRTDIPLGAIHRVLYPNDMNFGQKVRAYLDRLWVFVSEPPRESNVEGGILPAIFGTVMMTFLMTLFVVPLGVVAGLYLREYAHQGRLVRLVRIAVNNLAGIPSIVFGIFGLGFFVYTVGGSIDQLFYADALPNPTFGTGGILWSALTLALLTVPVVIVATEEGLAAVPRAVREGSLALGASKWETTWRIVLPAASPGILTGVILAISRAAGEVAPLMITGAVKTANLLPVDGTAPYLHVERKFMHLGFHVYDLGFQSPNVEAAKPMVFMTTLFLVAIVVLLNVTAIWVRNRLWSKYRSASF